MFFVILFMHYTIQEKRRFENIKAQFVITSSYGKGAFVEIIFSIVSVGQYRLNLPDFVKYNCLEQYLHSLHINVPAPRIFLQTARKICSRSVRYFYQTEKDHQITKPSQILKCHFLFSSKISLSFSPQKIQNAYFQYLPDSYSLNLLFFCSVLPHFYNRFYLDSTAKSIEKVQKTRRNLRPINDTLQMSKSMHLLSKNVSAFLLRGGSHLPADIF